MLAGARESHEKRDDEGKGKGRGLRLFRHPKRLLDVRLDAEGQAVIELKLRPQPRLGVGQARARKLDAGVERV